MNHYMENYYMDDYTYGLEREVGVDGIRLENLSEFKYLECVLDEVGND